MDLWQPTWCVVDVATLAGLLPCPWHRCHQETRRCFVICDQLEKRDVVSAGWLAGVSAVSRILKKLGGSPIQRHKSQ